MRAPRDRLGLIAHAAVSVVDVVLMVTLVADLGIVIANVVARSFLGYSLIWGQELSDLALVVLTFLGAATAYARGQHPAVAAVAERLPARWRPLQLAFVEWTVVAVSGGAALVSVAVARQQFSQASEILHISRAWSVAPMTVGLTLISLFALFRLRAYTRSTVVASGVVVAAMLVALFGLSWLKLEIDPGIWLAVELVATAGILLLGVPVAFALMASALLYMVLVGTVPLVAIVTSMQAGVSNSVLLAIPFFVLAGFVMDKGAVTVRIIRFVGAVMGHLSGGLLQVEVIAMYIFSGISGSKGADMAAVGSAMRGTLKQHGYEPGESAAVLAASAAMGETIPPSIAMLLLGSITSLSIGALFIAGLLPATFIALMLMLTVYVRARRYGMPSEPRASGRQVVASAWAAILPGAMPALLVVGILTGFATPTEVSALAVLYGMLLAVGIYRALGPRQVLETLERSTTMAGMILFVVAAASAFAWVLTIQAVPATVADAMAFAPGGATGFLVISSIAIVVLGSLFEGLPAILIFAPILLPVAAKFHVDPLHFGIVFIVAMGVGAFAPPIGVGFYIACAVAGTTMEQTLPRMLPYFLVLLVGLLFIALVPSLTLALPTWAHLHG